MAAESHVPLRKALAEKAEPNNEDYLSQHAVSFFMSWIRPFCLGGLWLGNIFPDGELRLRS